MTLQCGIVGLPNVGKSTLFNALTQAQNAEASNFPFCTIEPNVGRVAVPDARLAKIAKLANTNTLIPNFLEFVDIAGLVAGASKGEGLGNQFLANIREVDAILHVVRCFADDNITHVAGKIAPLSDIEIIETELMLADLESLQKRIPNLEKKARSGDKELQQQLQIVKEILTLLEDGKPARVYQAKTEEDQKIFKMLQLLTAKKVIFVCNVAEDEVASGNNFSSEVADYAHKNEAEAVVVSAKIEEEIAGMEDVADRAEFLESLGLEASGLDRLVRASYDLLHLITYFTAGEKEARAWTIKEGWLAPQAAGVIHTDFEKKFIKAETISYDDYIEYQGDKGAREAGKMRQEGKGYVVQDADILLFKL
jgi:ribosome-binding ATPase